MTIADLRCDVCGRFLSGPSIDDTGGTTTIRVMFHPGDGRLKDDSTLLCGDCWTPIEAGLGEAERWEVCARCDTPVASDDSLHVSRVVGGPGPWPTWQLCRAHAAEFLNGLRTTDPKLTEATLSLRRDFLKGPRETGSPFADPPR